MEEEKRNKVKELKEEMNSLSTDYQKNLGEENAKFEFSAAELKGCPEDFLAPRKKADTEDVYQITLKVS